MNKEIAIAGPTVADLIAALQQLPQDGHVVLYNYTTEDHGEIVDNIVVQERDDDEDDWLYDKSDHPFDDDCAAQSQLVTITAWRGTRPGWHSPA
jgi:hypothetical protein